MKYQHLKKVNGEYAHFHDFQMKRHGTSVVSVDSSMDQHSFVHVRSAAHMLTGSVRSIQPRILIWFDQLVLTYRNSSFGLYNYTYG